MSKHVYFVSFVASKTEGNRTYIGPDNFSVTKDDGPINSYGDIQKIQAEIGKRAVPGMEGMKVTVLNFQLLRVEE